MSTWKELNDEMDWMMADYGQWGAMGGYEMFKRDKAFKIPGGGIYELLKEVSSTDYHLEQAKNDPEHADWTYICEFLILEESFIREYKDYLNMRCVRKYQKDNLSKDFKREMGWVRS